MSGKITPLRIVIGGIVSAAAVVALYHPVFFKEMMAVNRTDALFLYLPWNHYLAESYKALSLPAWNPFFNLGQPAVGASPFCAIVGLYLFMEPWWANTVYIIAGLWCLFFTSWFYMRTLGFSGLAAAVGCIAYSFSGLVFYFHSYYPCLTAFVMLPLLMILLERWRRDKSKPALIILAAALLLAAQSAVFDQLFYIFIAIVLSIAARPAAGKGRAFYITLWILILAAAYSTASALFVPLKEWMAHSTRGFIAAGRDSSYYPDIANVLRAAAFGRFVGVESQPFEEAYYYYIGLPTVILGLLGSVTIAGKDRFKSRLFLLSLVFPAGYLLFRVLYFLKFPFLPDVGYWRGMSIFIFTLSIMAAAGAQYLLDIDASRKWASLAGSALLAALIAWMVYANGSLAYRHIDEWCLIGKASLVRRIKESNDLVARALHSGPGKGRVTNYGRRNRLEFLTLSDIRVLPAYNNVHSRALQEALIRDRIIEAPESAANRYLWWFLDEPDAKKLAFYGVRYLSVDRGRRLPGRFAAGWEERGEFGGRDIRENQYYRGRAYILSSDGKMRDERVSLEEASFSEVRLRVQSARPGDRLVLADLAYPGWEATVNGEAAAWREYRGCLREVALEPGANEIVWRFGGAGLQRGLKISFFSFILFVVLIFALYLAKERRIYYDK